MLLEYSDDYSRSVAKNDLWYLDLADSHERRPAQADYNAGFHVRQALTSDSKNVTPNIPLNRYSFFETLEGRLLPPPPPMHLTIELELTPLMSKFVSDYQKISEWTNLRELYQSSDVFRNSGDFRISPAIDKVKHVFIYAQREKTNDMTENPYIFDTFKLNAADNNCTISTCRLEYGNGTFYPEYAYESDDKNRIFSDLMNFSWKKNDYNTGTQLTFLILPAFIL